jgi:hypothetical protein
MHPTLRAGAEALVTGRWRVVGIMGASVPSAGALADARQLGRLVAEAGWVVLTGGRPDGVMGAACAGAKEVEGSITVGVLPTAGRVGTDDIGPDVDIAIQTGLGDARNAVNVLSSDVVVACGMESPGTASEVALALAAGRPLVLVGASAAALAFVREIAGMRPVHVAADAAEAFEVIRRELNTP